jgi:hypothetical protein
MFDIDQKKIVYRDRKWPAGINFIPKDMNLVRTVIMSRNRIAAEMVKWINDANSGKNLEEWEACKDDYEVAEVIKREAKLKGCVFRQLFTKEELEKQDNKAVLQAVEQQDQTQEVEQVQEEQIQENEPIQEEQQ